MKSESFLYLLLGVSYGTYKATQLFQKVERLTSLG